MADLPITSDEGATPIVINDPTTTANVANVKAGSTAAGAGDSALVVTLSPNSPVPAGTNAIGSVTIAPTTAGGLSTNVQQALTTSAQIKSSAGQFYGHEIFNPNAGTVYVFYYNTTSAPTIGSTTNLIQEIGIPAGSAANWELTNGVVYGTGIYVAVSTAASSSAAPGTGLVITTLYK